MELPELSGYIMELPEDLCLWMLWGRICVCGCCGAGSVFVDVVGQDLCLWMLWDRMCVCGCCGTGSAPTGPGDSQTEEQRQSKVPERERAYVATPGAFSETLVRPVTDNATRFWN
ncbi:hypothetical protein ACOMHN_007600 [Nucella lapillus]